ncbi:MAG: hypothetical protein A3B47_04965 [Candidatus Levybacteria bacterium RIFCSPLOWO2_01_FULL_39_24]|nr:MAG: hypothetical protein A2800_04330 [Candidatus Levybacteria bacterium RIFCSPHIGHO2_01_FULL_40_16]OGH27981.1 MAG: hypothetical protein A3E12_02715 [Candidatus Levybacteria bacterium RIFCSPHIGHO2_12_FULL_39_9]OGH46789.1 MAG: hypothetical protein A3B47_04965 [Candidatus Levybacteria bacterium RIFCSPLOWO2_01_FULL_39_24]
MTNKGLFIVIDGPSASGKDSIIKQVLKDLSELGVKALSIEETKEKNYNRKKILKEKNKGNQEVARAIIDERKKLYQAKVIPQLESGTLVIANRGEPSTLIYQTFENQITMEEIWNMHRNETMLIPDLIVIVNCSVGEALRRESSMKISDENKDENSMSGKFTKDFERRKQIHAKFEKVRNFLERKKLLVIYLRTDIMDIQEESQKVVNFIKNKLNYVRE